MLAGDEASAVAADGAVYQLLTLWLNLKASFQHLLARRALGAMKLE